MTNDHPEPSLESLGLSVRSYSRLRGAGISTIAQLEAMSVAEVSKIGGIGGVYLSGFLEELASCGLQLRDSPVAGHGGD